MAFYVEILIGRARCASSNLTSRLSPSSTASISSFNRINPRSSGSEGISIPSSHIAIRLTFLNDTEFTDSVVQLGSADPWGTLTTSPGELSDNLKNNLKIEINLENRGNITPPCLTSSASVR